MSPTILELAAQARRAGLLAAPLPVRTADEDRLARLAGFPRRPVNWLPLLWLIWVAAAASFSVSGGAGVACTLVALTASAFRFSTAGELARRHRAIRALLEFASCLPFPLRGWRDLLLAPRPKLVVDLQTPADMDIVERALRAVAPMCAIEVASSTRFSIELPESQVLAAKDLIERVLVPLHEDVGILRVEAGTV